MSWQVIALIAVTILFMLAFGLALARVSSDADDFLEEQRRG